MMKAIRGATTISKDTPDEIKEAVKELLFEIRDKNDLQEERITAIMFSNTGDIRSFYPAKAAREAGFASCALFSSAEPEIEGSLKLCIRVMILAEIDKKPINVYLREAKNLRKDISSVINIALDGPAGSGKSTVAKLLAREYDILYLDTGAMYRACALKVLNCGSEPRDRDVVEEIMRGINLEVKYMDGSQHTFLDGKDVSEDIRRPEVSLNASVVAAYSFVREKMVELQRKIAASSSCILDGRDIGTFVIPQTPFKFFITASPDVKAKRRYDELRAKGFDVDYDKIKEEIILRDKQDSERAVSPLKCADDAVVVDTSDMTVEEVVSFIKNKIQEKI